MKYKYHKDGTTPQHGEIFVFGSNLAGIHGAGAAREAFKNYGAIYGVGVGMKGTSYAIPTKDRQIETLPLEPIRKAVAMFKIFADNNPQEEFFVTRVGCFYAGYTDADIAPMFQGSPTNCNFAEDWQSHLE